MVDVLVELPGGLGLVHFDGERFDFCLASDVTSGAPGQPVGYQDRYAPERMHVGEGRFLVGGLLPPGAVSAEVVDDRGARTAAVVGHGAYVVLQEESDWRQEVIVCCRDDSGIPVRRPWAADYPSVRVTDAQDPCPACGAIDYDEYTPFEDWRGGRGSKVDGTNIPNPIVSCRVCGHEEREGSFMTMRSDHVAEEDEATRAARMARFRAEHARRQWLAAAEILPTAGFAIYSAAGWSAHMGAHGTQNHQLTEVGVQLFERASPESGDRPRLTITTRHDEHRLGLLDAAQTELTNWVPQDSSGGWPELSRAALTLWLRARERERNAMVLTAARS